MKSILRHFHTFPIRMQNAIATMEKHTPSGPAILCLGIFLRKIKTSSYANVYTYVHNSILHEDSMVAAQQIFINKRTDKEG